MKKTIRNSLLLAGVLSAFCLPATAQKAKSSLNHIALYIVDLKKSTAFYTDAMQLEVIPEPFHDGKHTWYKIGEHSQFHLIEGAKSVTPHDMNTHTCFSVPSVEQFVERISKLQLKYFNAKGAPQSITTRVDGVKQVYLQDPDGFWLEVNDDKY